MMFSDESFCNDSDSHCIAKGHFESQVFTGIKTPIDPLIVSEIKKWCPRYKKIYHGTHIALDIGLDLIRKDCHHFNDW